MEGKLQELHRTNSNLRDALNNIHVAFHELLNFNQSLREQIRRNLYYAPPPGIVYGEQTRTIGTQTDFVPPKVNERTDPEVKTLLERDGC